MIGGALADMAFMSSSSGRTMERSWDEVASRARFAYCGRRRWTTGNARRSAIAPIAEKAVVSIADHVGYISAGTPWIT